MTRQSFAATNALRAARCAIAGALSCAMVASFMVPTAALAQDAYGTAQDGWKYLDLVDFSQTMTDSEGDQVPLRHLIYDNTPGFKPETVSGASYNAATNTLTLSNYSAGTVGIDACGLGDDFTIKVSGSNSLQSIMTNTDPSAQTPAAASVNIAGDGKLTVNENREAAAAIIIDGEYTDTKITTGDDVQLGLHSGQGSGAVYVMENSTAPKDKAVVLGGYHADLTNAQDSKDYDAQTVHDYARGEELFDALELVPILSTVPGDDADSSEGEIGEPAWEAPEGADDATEAEATAGAEEAADATATTDEPAEYYVEGFDDDYNTVYYKLDETGMTLDGTPVFNCAFNAADCYTGDDVLYDANEAYVVVESFGLVASNKASKEECFVVPSLDFDAFAEDGGAEIDMFSDDLSLLKTIFYVYEPAQVEGETHGQAFFVQTRTADGVDDGYGLQLPQGFDIDVEESEIPAFTDYFLFATKYEQTNVAPVDYAALQAAADKADAEAAAAKAAQDKADAGSAAAKAAADREAMEKAAKQAAADRAKASKAQKAAEKAEKAAKTVKVGQGVAYGKQFYKVTKVATAAKAGTVTFLASKNAKKVSVPKTIKLADGKRYKVTSIAGGAFTGSKISQVTVGKYVKKIAKNAFAGSKATSLIVKSKKLKKKKSVKGAFKNSKVKTVKVKVSSAKKTNKKYVKKYKKSFTKKNTGTKAKRLTVK